MKNITAIIGWTLLAAILAVPSFLFYNWWMNKQAAKAREMPQNVPAKVFPPGEGGSADPPSPFAESVQTENNGAGFSSDVSLSPAPEEETPETERSENEENAAIGLAAEDREEDPELDGQSVSVRKSSTPARVESSTATAAGPETGETAKKSYYNPQKDRDPTLSPEEYAKIKYEIARREELERQRRLERMRQAREKNKPPQLNFQGIIGDMVIIGGEKYSAGDSVKGVKILKISANSFTGYYKGKKFKVYLK